MEHISKYLADVNTFLAESQDRMAASGDKAMDMYTVATALKRMDYDETYELVSELEPRTQMRLYQALRDQMDHED